MVTDSAELYDPVSGTFSPIASMNEPRQQHAATLLPNGQVLVTGGFDGSTDVSSAELFFPSNLSSLSPPSASFSVDVKAGVAPLAVKFAHTSQGPLTTVEWDFGDGTTSTEFSPSHTYTTAGSHAVRLSAIGTGGVDTIVMPDLITAEPGPLASVVVEPGEVVMDIWATQRFTAKPIDEFGNEVSDVLVSWSALPELWSIDDIGVLTASGNPGTYDGVAVKVTQATHTRTGTAKVTLRPDPLATIEVRPSTIVIGEGDTQRFTAHGFDQYGHEIPGLEYMWQARGGSIEVGRTDGHTAEFTGDAPTSRHEIAVSAEFKGQQRFGFATFGVAPVWMPTGSMGGPRRGHTASSSPSEDYLTVLAGQRQWIATTNFAGCPGRPPDSFANSAVLTTSAKVPDALGWPIDPCFPVQIDPKAEQFEQVVACADQRPFAVHLLQSPQQELPESPALLDLAEYRLHSLHPQSVALPTLPGL